MISKVCVCEREREKEIEMGMGNWLVKDSFLEELTSDLGPGEAHIKCDIHPFQHTWLTFLALNYP